MHVHCEDMLCSKLQLDQAIRSAEFAHVTVLQMLQSSLQVKPFSANSFEAVLLHSHTAPMSDGHADCCHDAVVCCQQP